MAKSYGWSSTIHYLTSGINFYYKDTKIKQICLLHRHQPAATFDPEMTIDKRLPGCAVTN